MRRACRECDTYIPPETKHFYDTGEGDYYCVGCLDEQPYTAYTYFDKSGNFVGLSEEDIEKVEKYEDEYMGEEE